MFKSKTLLLNSILLFAINALVLGQDGVKINLKTVCSPDSEALKKLPAHQISKLEIPDVKPTVYIISHTAYTISYNEIHEQANWVAYELTKDETIKTSKRSNIFTPDPKVITESACNLDYENSGYDRGHLAPAADMGWSKVSIAESFYYSNMSPQEPSFNRGVWKKLEELVRSWAIENNSIYVVTGPVLSENLKAIGLNKVSVPNYFYKVILDYSEPEIKAIGFILPNSGSQKQLQDYVVSVDSVEKITNIDFFPLLPDDQEYLLEKTICLNCWTWKHENKLSDTHKTTQFESEQCYGTTKSGLRCKNKTRKKIGYCTKHVNQFLKNNQNSINPEVKK